MLKKKLLFIVPSYMNYNIDLTEALSNLYEVFEIIDGVNTAKEISRFSEDFFDIIFVIRGDSLPKIQNYIKQFKAERKILYEWDSLKNFDYSLFIELFDTVKTFDMEDAKEKNLGYLPLFYSKNSFVSERKNDVLFIGIWHSDRYQLLIKFYHILKKAQKRVCFKLYYKWYYYIPFIILRKIKSFRFYTPKMISRKKVESLYRSSKAVLDLSHPNQTGFTMRTIEALGNGCKLITTNKNIASASFYNNDNVFIFDRSKEINTSALLDFLDKPFVQNFEIEKQEINNWVREVLK